MEAISQTTFAREHQAVRRHRPSAICRTAEAGLLGGKPNDWLSRYGFSPVLLETFVEYERHKGTCYKAANWIKVGRTTGRGKKSTSHKHLIPAKDIWLYPLRKNFAAKLCQ